MDRSRRTLAAAIAASALPFPWAGVHARSYPTGPVKFIVAFAAGGPIDLAARVVAEALTQKLGQPFIVENRTGANGAIAAEAVKAAPADGQTVLITNASMITITPTLVKNLRYDVERDFAPVTRIAASPLILVVNPENSQTREVRSVAELISLAKQSPGQVSYGSAGLNGNVQQLAFELMADRAGVKLLSVPYKGSSEAQLALLSQNVALGFDTLTAIPHIKSGKLRPLAVSSKERLSALPDVPTMQEVGYPNFEIGFWSGVFLPKATPSAVVDTLNQAVVEVCKDAGIRTKLEPFGSVVAGPPDEFRQHIRAETTTLAEVIRRAKIEPQ